MYAKRRRIGDLNDAQTAEMMSTLHALKQGGVLSRLNFEDASSMYAAVGRVLPKLNRVKDVQRNTAALREKLWNVGTRVPYAGAFIRSVCDVLTDVLEILDSSANPVQAIEDTARIHEEKHPTRMSTKFYGAVGRRLVTYPLPTSQEIMDIAISLTDPEKSGLDSWKYGRRARSHRPH